MITIKKWDGGEIVGSAAVGVGIGVFCAIITTLGWLGIVFAVLLQTFAVIALLFGWPTGKIYGVTQILVTVGGAIAFWQGWLRLPW